jgi:hypothetical protein
MTQVAHGPLAENVCRGPAAFMAGVYWSNALKARHPIIDAAMDGQAMLWGIVTSTAAPACVRKAAERHLYALREHPDPENPGGSWSAA